MQRRKIASATREEFENLAGELEAVWNHPESDAGLKKRIVRVLIEEVVVDVDGQGGEIIAHTPKEIVEAVKVLVRICSDDTMGAAGKRRLCAFKVCGPWSGATLAVPARAISTMKPRISF